MMFGNIFWLLIAGVFIYMMMKGGGCCGGHKHGGHGTTGSDQMGDGIAGNGHQSHGENKRDDSISDLDPVCGMVVQNGSLAGEYSGKNFHFCSEQCLKLFNLNPKKYA